MLDRRNQILPSLLFGCVTCVLVTSVVNADGRVFVLDLRNSFREAEQACASRHAHLASAEELRRAVMECFFSSCTRGWLHGGIVGTTVCNTVGSALKAVDVRTENATEDPAHLDAFCIKDKDTPCGDPPSFPNARLQGHTGLGMGDELLYTCEPGYMMPSGQSSFSLLCDSCGEWYGLVQICVKEETESHIDYEDKFTDSHGGEKHNNERPEEAHGQVHEELHTWKGRAGKNGQEKEMSFSVREEDHRDQHEERGEVLGRKLDGAVEEGEKGEERAVEDFISRPRWEKERKEVVRTSAAAATEAPVSLLSQKHMFWFPSEAFPSDANPVTQTMQRASGAQSQESKEHESRERQDEHVGVDDHEQEQDSYDADDTDDRDDHNDSHHDDQDVHDDSHRDDHDDLDSHQDKDELDDIAKHYIPAQHDDLNGRDDHDNDDDMGEHEDDRVHHSSRDDRDDTFSKQESYEDHEDVTDDHGDDDLVHGSEEHPDRDDHDDGEEHYDLDEDENDRYTDQDNHEHDDHDNYDDHDSHEDDADGHVIFSIATGERRNVTQKAAGGKTTTDETWLDGYPVVPEETSKGDSTRERVRPEDRERVTDVRATDRPNEIEIRRPVPYTRLPEEPESRTTEPELEQTGVEEVWPDFIATAAPFPDHLEPSDSPSYSDTLDYDTQQAAPTHSWLGDLTEHPFLDHAPAPPVHDSDILTGTMGEHPVRHLPGEAGERGEVEGEKGEAICTGENCPPHPPSSTSQGPTVAAVIVAMCVIVAAVITGVWCYRRQQQKSSVYEMNGKGQCQSRQGQQIEMQQKV
ncbi:sushi domain-containing protein 5 [Mastacembelus armatus]|uniref:sushi domain-containing protein 5 n=1 Tax=Mastacembelus armatus TaxID=205130 RepID=UPI000E45CCB4|nr:sushi domain-containing protein 5 [Mastacembelus armatus]